MLPTEIYTDGSAKNGRGAWAYVMLRDGEVIREASGAIARTTSLRMEFQAAIEALRDLPDRTPVRIMTDCKIMVEEFTLNKQLHVKRPNFDQLRALHELNQNLHINWIWVKAHHGHTYNEKCDHLCMLALNGQ